MWSTCLRSGGGGILGGGLGTSFVSVHGDKLGVSEGAVDGNMVGLAGRDTGVAVLGQEYVLFYGKEPVEVREGGSGAATIMDFWTLEGYAVGFLKGVALAVLISILGGDKGAGSVLSGGYFEGSCYGNIEGVSPGEGDPLGMS